MKLRLLSIMFLGSSYLHTSGCQSPVSHRRHHPSSQPAKPNSPEPFSFAIYTTGHYDRVTLTTLTTHNEEDVLFKLLEQSGPLRVARFKANQTCVLEHTILKTPAQIKVITFDTVHTRRINGIECCTQQSTTLNLPPDKYFTIDGSCIIKEHQGNLTFTKKSTEPDLKTLAAAAHSLPHSLPHSRADSGIMLVSPHHDPHHHSSKSHPLRRT